MNSRIRVLLVGAFIGMFAAIHPVMAQPVKLGEQIQEARKTGDWSAVKQRLQAKADAGDLAALTAVAEMQLYGLGGPRDVSQSLVNLRKAAGQNFALAQSFLGFHYAVGLGVARDPAAAAEWYRKAAAQGISEAQYNLGVQHSSGELGSVDFRAARELFERAAAQGFPKAKLNLGVLHLHGSGLPGKDLTKAQELLKQAADAGETAAQFNLGLLLARGELGAPQPVLGYYYLVLASSADSRGPCVPAAVWIAARLDDDPVFSSDLIMRDELARASCMTPHPQAKRLVDGLEQLAEKYPEMKSHFQTTRTAASQFLERRKTLDAPVDVKVASMRSQNYEGEYAFLQSLPHWQFVRMMERSGDTRRSEMRPPDETGENWKKTLRYEQVSKLKYAKPAEHVEPILAELRKRCGEVALHTTFEGEERGFATYVGTAVCPGKEEKEKSASEMHFFKAVQGLDSFYFWHAVWRADATTMNDEASIKTTVTELVGALKSQIVCDTRVKQGAKSCPAGLPRM
jgi:TPR repeat protein